MSVGEENWQMTRPTIRERTKFFFNNDRLSDIRFVVRKMDGESESKQVIPAHMFVLSISSPVFEAMFHGELAETRDTDNGTATIQGQLPELLFSLQMIAQNFK